MPCSVCLQGRGLFPGPAVGRWVCVHVCLYRRNGGEVPVHREVRDIWTSLLDWNNVLKALSHNHCHTTHLTITSSQEQVFKHHLQRKPIHSNKHTYNLPYKQLIVYIYVHISLKIIQNIINHKQHQGIIACLLWQYGEFIFNRGFTRIWFFSYILSTKENVKCFLCPHL